MAMDTERKERTEAVPEPKMQKAVAPAWWVEEAEFWATIAGVETPITCGLGQDSNREAVPPRDSSGNLPDLPKTDRQIVTLCPKCRHAVPGLHCYCPRCGWEPRIDEQR